MSGWLVFFVLFGIVIFVVWAIKSDGKSKRKQEQKHVIEELAGEPLNGLYREGENAQMEENILACMSEMAQALEAKMDALGFPKIGISSPQQVFASMSPGMRRKMATHVNQVFAKGAADMVALELAAIIKLAEIIHRVEFFQEQKAIAIHQTNVAAETAPQILRNSLRGVENLSAVYDDYAHLDGPFKPLGNLLTAEVARSLVDDLQQSLGRTDPQLHEAVKELIPYVQAQPEPAALGLQEAQADMEVVDGEYTDPTAPHSKNGQGKPRAYGKEAHARAGRGHRA